MSTPRFLIPALLFCMACGAASPTASAPKNVRADARAAVDVAKDAWVVTANACLDAAQLTGDTSLKEKCGVPLEAAHDLIIAAADAVDTQWTDGAACSLARATLLIQSVVPALGAPGADVAAVTNDAAAVAQRYVTAACVMDAGADR